MTELQPLVFDPKEIPPTSPLTIALETVNSEEELIKAIENTDAPAETGLSADELAEVLIYLSAFAAFAPAQVMSFKRFFEAQNLSAIKVTEDEALRKLSLMLNIEGMFAGFINDPSGMVSDFGMKTEYQNTDSMRATFDLKSFQAVSLYSPEVALRVLEYFSRKTELVEEVWSRPGRYMVNPKVEENVNRLALGED